MAPVRVKLYGLVSVTKRRYLTQLVVALVMAAGLMLAWVLYWPSIRGHLEEAQSPVLDTVVRFWDAAPYIILAIVLLQAIEGYIVLRRFESKEAAEAQTPKTT